MDQNPNSENVPVNSEAEGATAPGPVASPAEFVPDTTGPVASPAEFVPDTTGPKPDDLQTRVKNFNEDLKLIQEKHELTLGAEAKIVNGMVFAEPKVLDTRMILAQKAAEEKARAEGAK